MVYSPWGLKESAMTEQQSTATPTFSLEHVHASDRDSHRIAASAWTGVSTQGSWQQSKNTAAVILYSQSGWLFRLKLQNNNKK